MYDTSQCSLEMSSRCMPGQEGGGVSINASHTHESLEGLFHIHQ